MIMRKHAAFLSVTKAQPYSQDRNIWHMSHEGGDLEYITKERPDDLLMLITPRSKRRISQLMWRLSSGRGPVRDKWRSLRTGTLLETLNLLARSQWRGILDLLKTGWWG